MNISDNNIIDPDEYPVVFTPKEREVILFTIKKYPISFMIDEYPRKANIVSLGVKQMGAFYLNHDVYRDTNVALFSKNMTHRIELDANRKNLLESNFFLKFYVSKTNFLTIRPGQIQVINQPSGNANVIHHLFAMLASTRIFNPIEFEGDDYYPTATLSLKFHAHGMHGDFTWTDVVLPDMSETLVPISPIDSYGLLDVEVGVVFKWYNDVNRTHEVVAPMVEIEPKKFGMRFCISEKGGRFKQGVQTTRTGNAIASELYSTPVLQNFFPDEYHQVYCWGRGERDQDLFIERVENLIISDNGLPVQDGSPRGMYILDNPLEDIDFSSSSSISSSSVSSVSSSSISSSSVSSMSSSSISSSSVSSSSSSSVSSSSSSSISSSSSSSSTETMTTSSSASTSSSLHTMLLFDYRFSEHHDEFGNVIDSTEHNRHAKVSSNSPIWSLNQDVGGIYSYFSNAYGSQLIYSMNANSLGCHKGTLSTWMRPNSRVLNISSVLFSLTNDFTYKMNQKKEFMVGVDAETNKLFATAVIDGYAMWQMNGPDINDLIGEWTNVVVLHNGSIPSFYINGVLYPSTFVVETDKSVWFNSLLVGTNRADRLVIGATTRNFQPLYTFGWNGDIGMTKMWNFNLSAQDVLSQYQSVIS